MVIPDVARRRPLPVGPRHRPAPVRRLDAVGAADLARPGRRRAQRPDGDPPRLQRRRRRPAVRDRRPPRGHRREGPPPARGRGAGRAAQGARPGPERADRARHPRAAHAARGRPRLHGPARGRAAARRADRRATRSGARTRAAWHQGTIEQIERLDRLVDSILDVRARGPGPAADARRRRHRAGSSTTCSASSVRCSRGTSRGSPRSRRLHVDGRSGAAFARCWSTCSRTP